MYIRCSSRINVMCSRRRRYWFVMIVNVWVLTWKLNKTYVANGQLLLRMVCRDTYLSYSKVIICNYAISWRLKFLLQTDQQAFKKKSHDSSPLLSEIYISHILFMGDAIHYEIYLYERTKCTAVNLWGITADNSRKSFYSKLQINCI